MALRTAATASEAFILESKEYPTMRPEKASFTAQR
jgi:hypothetical protein